MNRIYLTLLSLLCLLTTFTACSEDIYDGAADAGGQKVTLRLRYRNVAATPVNITRAARMAIDKENRLSNLQIFVFDDKGNFKGYKFLEAKDLVQDGSTGTVEVKTTSGLSRILAVANVPSNIYPLYYGNNTLDNVLPASLQDVYRYLGGEQYEEFVQSGAYKNHPVYNYDVLKDVAFSRDPDHLAITDHFLMSGWVGDEAGKGLCTITRNADGTGTADHDQINLKRIVAKVKFIIKTAGADAKVKSRSFVPEKYDIRNIPIEGSLVEGGTGTGNGQIHVTHFTDFNGGTFSNQDVNPTLTEYLPENLQTTTAEADARLKTWDDREADQSANDPTKTDDENKKFINAPQNATYVVLYGRYTENYTDDWIRQNGGVRQRIANVRYYVHLGDFNTQLNDFSVRRNTSYTYTVTVAGVDKLIVQVNTSDDPQPAAEGIVFDFTTGQQFILDSHYGQCNMTFSQRDMQAVTENGKLKYGYFFRVSDINGMSDVCYVNDQGEVTHFDKDRNPLPGGLNNARLDWLHFADGAYQDFTTAYQTYNNVKGCENGKLKSLQMVLKELRDNAMNDAFWTNGEKTYTCFVDENYYSDKRWGAYVNKDPRKLYIAKNVKESADGRTVYVDAVYTLMQHSIKTFYNTDYDGSTSKPELAVYGLETIRDDWHLDETTHKPIEPWWGGWNTGDIQLSKGTDHWDGRDNMKKDLPLDVAGGWKQLQWKQYTQACMSRNRDLNGDGIIEDNEVRWYCPAIDQYAGMWIGENAIDDPQARLFSGRTTDLEDEYGSDNRRKNGEHYFSNTQSLPVFWSEEGMATGNGLDDSALKYIRCVRNLQSGNVAVGGLKAATYYVWDFPSRTVDLDRINPKALNTTPAQNTELLEHEERGADNLTLSSAKRKFTIATERCDEQLKDNGLTTAADALTATTTPCASYRENGERGWRMPNQRELCLMTIVGMLNSTADNFTTCRTGFSSPLRYIWYVNIPADNYLFIRMYNKEKADNAQKAWRVRCVKER